MSSVSSPFGLRPSQVYGGQVRILAGTIITALAEDIWKHTPVRWADATGGLIPAPAGDTNILGVFMGVEWTDGRGRRQLSNFWESGRTGTDIVAYHTYDPMQVYDIQAVAAVEQLNVGDMANYDALAGDDTTGLANFTLDGTMAAGAANLRIVGINPGPDNAVGDSFTIVQVLIAEHAFNAFTVNKS